MEFKLLLILQLFFLLVLGAPTNGEVEDPPFTHKVTFNIEHGSKEGQLVLGLFGTVVPKTVENFVQLSTGQNGYGYVNSTFHRIIDNFMIQGGDIEHKDGRGGYSIYGKNFNDENFIIKHDRPGRLSMANAGPNTQGSQFFITTVVTSWLDGAHVVFGQMVEGGEFLNYLQKVATNDKSDKPAEDVMIKSIGVKEVPLDKDANADYFDDLKTRRHSSAAYFWIIVFAFLGVGGFALFRARKKNLIALRSDILFNR